MVFRSIDSSDDEYNSSSAEESDVEGDPVGHSLDWRDGHPNVLRQYLHMFRQGILTDCTLMVEDQEIRAHRVVLARASCVFEAMFSHENTVEVKTGTVNIRDLTSRGVRLMLEFMYTDHIKLTKMEDAAQVAMAADMYQVSRLLQLCQYYILKLHGPGNAWYTLDLANLLNLQAVRESCIHEIKRYTYAYIREGSSDFVQASEESVVMLMQLDSICTMDENEITIVNAVIGWARKEALRRGLPDDDVGVRKVIEPRVLPLLRLLLLPRKLFRSGSGFAGWLLSSERQKIHKFGHQKKPKNYVWPQTLSTETKKRERDYSDKVDHVKLNRLRSKHCVKRNIITTHANLRMRVTEPAGFATCSDCNNLCLYVQNHQYCHHASVIFKAKSSCNLYAVECATRVSKDKSIPRYQESIKLFYHCMGIKLNNNYEDPTFRKIGEFEGQVQFNSVIPVKCEEELSLSAYKWYILHVCYQEFSSEPVGSMEYPNVTCPRRALSSSNIKFVFQETPGPRDTVQSRNTGLVRKLIIK